MNFNSRFMGRQIKVNREYQIKGHTNIANTPLSKQVIKFFDEHPDNPTIMSDVLLNEQNRVHIATNHNRQIVGVLITNFEAKIPELKVSLVHPEWQNLGIGLELMRSAITHCRIRGHPLAKLRVVNPRLMKKYAKIPEIAKIRTVKVNHTPVSEILHFPTDLRTSEIIFRKLEENL